MMRRVLLIACVVAMAVLASAATNLKWSGGDIPVPYLFEMVQRIPQSHPDVQINYQSIGSGGGIRQVLAGTVDFGASDGPMSDQDLAQSKTKILHLPTVLGAVVPAYNVAGVSGELKIHSRRSGRHLSWHDHQVERPGDCQRKSRHQSAG